MVLCAAQSGHMGSCVSFHKLTLARTQRSQRKPEGSSLLLLQLERKLGESFCLKGPGPSRPLLLPHYHSLFPCVSGLRDA